MRRIWPKITKIYWDPDYDIPVIRPRSEQVDLFYVLKLTEPGDARPGFLRDYERLRKSIEYELGSDKLYKELFESKFILLNKVPHWDQMWEIISSGNVWGQLYYDPYRVRWRFRLTFAGAYYGVENNIVEKIIVHWRIRKGQVLEAGTDVNQVVIVDENNRVMGIAEKRDSKYVVIRVFRGGKPPVETSNRKSDLNTVLKYNREGIEWFKERSIRFLKKLYEKHKLPVVVSYSGGKDSLVALHLTLEALGNATMLFNDTGLELPDTIDNVEYVKNYFDLKLVEAKAGNAFWEALPIFGPPGKDYRWCCKIAKLTPIAKTTRAKWSTGALNIVGQRAFESIDRAKSPVVWRNKWVPHLLSTTPIQDWNQLTVWLYIYLHKLPYNPLYDVGFERLGCYLCPSSTLAEFHEIEKKYPCMWRKWLEELEKWRVKLNQPLEWITLGLWRWATPATAKYRLAKHVEGYKIDWKEEYRKRLLFSKTEFAPMKSIVYKDELIIEFNRNLIDQGELLSFKANMEMLKYKVIIEDDEIIIETRGSRINIAGNKLRVTPYKSVENLEDLVDVLKTIYRIKGCVKCGSCVLWCPLKRIRLTDKGPVPPTNCPACRVCLEVCPISEVLVEKIVLPLITNDPYIWSRPSRRRAAEEYIVLSSIT